MATAGAGPAVRDQLRRARLAVVAYFVVFGVTNGNWLARIPAIRQDLHLSDGMLGLALLAGPAGSFAVAWIAGAFMDRVGSPTPTMAGGAVVALLPISFGLATDQAVLMAAMFVFGVAAGVLDVGMNAQAVHVERACGRQLMTSFHACYSFGALAGGLIAGGFAWSNVMPVADFAVVGVPLAALALLARRWLLTASRVERPAHAREPAPGLRAPGLPVAGLPIPGVPVLAPPEPAPPARRISPLLVLSALALCSLLGEGAADGWSAVYLRDNLGTSQGLAAMAFSAFALAMAFGRLAGDRLAGRFGPVAVLRAGGLLAAVGMVGVLLSANPVAAITGFAVYGVGLSCTFPQLLAMAGHVRPDRPASAIARVAGTGYAGLLSGPVLIGGMASVAGLSVALVLPAALALCITLCAGLGVGQAPATPHGSPVP